MFTNTKALTEAQEALAGMTAERDAALTKAGEHETRVTALSSELASAKNVISALETAKTQAEAGKLEAENALNGFKADFDTKVDAEVLNRCAAAGIAPVARDSSASDPDSQKTLTRAEFDKLDHSARNTFFTSGGKLTD